MSPARAWALLGAVLVLALAVAAGSALAAAGALDTSFSDDGKVTEGFGATADSAAGVAIDSQNRVVVAGWSIQPGGPGTNYDFAVARYTPEGDLDTTFSQDGKRLQSFGNASEEDFARAVAVDSQDRVVVVGASDQDTTTGINFDFAIARYLESGSLDTSFSSDGKRLQNFATAPNEDDANGVAVDSQDRVVVAGVSEQGAGGTDEDFAIARFLESGSLDTSFSSDGKRVQNFTPAPDDDEGNAVAIDSQGRIVAAGQSDQTGGTGVDFAIARFLANGSLDTSFSSDGKRVQNFVTGENSDVANAVAVDSQNRVIAAGRSDQDPGAGSDRDFAIARFATNGGLDSSFSSDGKTSGPFTAGATNEEANGVAVDSLDRVVAAGLTDVNPDPFDTNNDFAIGRFLESGPLDTSFSSDGKRLQNFDSEGGSEEAQALAVDSQNRIVVVGQAAPNTTDFAIARFLGA